MILFWRFLIGCFLFVLSGMALSATGFVSYTPAANIYLSGSNISVRFDVAQVLHDNASISVPSHLNTASRSFSGTFYLSGAGWVLFDTGTYVTRLDCGIQSLNTLTTNCILSGSAWSETIGDIIFDRRVEYLPATGTLSGKILTNIGDFSLDTIILPLRPMNLSLGNNYSLIANTGISMGINNYLAYESSGGVIDATFIPIGTTFPISYVATSSWYADLSLASDYILTITDQNGSLSKYLYSVTNDIPSLGLDTAIASTKKQSFCSLYPTDSRCPDGSNLLPTLLTHSVGGVAGVSTTIADGQSQIDALMRLRDRYGNPITSGNLNINYSMPIRNIQTNLGDSVSYTPSILGDAVSVSVPVVNFFDGTGTTGNIPMSGQSFNYSFLSNAPGTISLRSIKYNGVDMGISAPDLIFTPWYTLTAFTSSDIRIGMSAIFTGTVVNHSTRNDTNPSIIHGLSIGYNVFAVFSGFSSSIAPICQASFIDTSGYTGINECKWTAMNGRYFPSLYVRALSSNPSEYSFSGMYTPLISLPYVPPEGSTISSYITYPLGGNTVIYPTTSYTLMASTFQQMRIRILGQIQSDGWYQGLGKTGMTKTDFFNALRKNIALLTRNQKDLPQSTFIYTGSLSHITTSTLSTKRSYIAEGADITIDENIALSGHPLVIISLKNPDTGLGGSIRISSGVTDIHATLMGEAIVTSTGSKQLYIHGSVISSNTTGGASRTTPLCPYFETLPCTIDRAKLYDLEYWRSDYLGLASILGHTALSPTAQRYQDTSLIIEYDSRVQSDPPPGVIQ